MCIATLLCAAALSVAMPVHAQQAPPAAQWVTLGTGGGPVIRLKRSEPANALVVGKAIYLFDVGDGAERQMVAAKLPLGRVKAIFISHHHLDHNAGLAPILMKRWLFVPRQPIPVYGPPGTKEMVAGIATANHPTALAPIRVGGQPWPSIDTSFVATDFAPVLDVPTLVYQDGNVRVLAIGVDHFHMPAGTPADRTPRSYAFRVEIGGRVFVYSGDTGPSANLVTLARGADVLISEVIDLKAIAAAMNASTDPDAGPVSPLMAHMELDHLTPAEVAKTASAAGVKRVVLTHLVPGLDSETDLSGYTAGIKPIFDGPVVVARDLDRFDAEP